MDNECAIPDCDRRRKARGYCRKHYERAFKHGDPYDERRPGQQRRTPLENFRRHYTPISPDACWEWQGSLMTNGYGHFHMDGRTIGAHRAAHLLLIGPLADGQHVLHRCDNRKCVNPSHLQAGTHQENVDDCIGKLRHSYADDHGNAKLTSEQVLNMRERRKRGETVTSLAAAYGVAIGTASRAINGVDWRLLKLEGENNDDPPFQAPQPSPPRRSPRHPVRLHVH